MNEKDKLMNELQALQFSLVDLWLYLDSHPENAQAIKTCRELSKRRDEVVKEYEQSFGALTPGACPNADYWDWVATPFPWEQC